MYHLVRKVHLFSSVIILAFLGMYFISGYIMVHRPWFANVSPPPTTRKAALQGVAELSTEPLAAAAQEQLRLPGLIQFPQKQPPGMTRFWVNHPGTMVRVDIPDGSSEVLVTTQRTGWVGVLIMLHKVRGYGGSFLFDAVALFSDIAGVSMILFAFTGVYLWWKRVRNHRWGLLCLAVSGAYVLGMMSYFSFAR